MFLAQIIIPEIALLLQYELERNSAAMKKIKKPWPTKEAMIQIYEKNLWGRGDSKFFSGEGSHHPDLIEPYIEVVIDFLKSFDDFITVCDLGCGDFNVGSKLVDYTSNFIGIDIVPEIINYNKSYFKNRNLEFQCLDIAKDDLPKADCAMIRQVLQHLSNKEIISIVNKLYSFKYVIITEHIPDFDFIPNVDIISGQGIRLKKDSGVDLLASPFNLKPKKEKLLLSLTLDNSKGRIETKLYEFE